MSSESSTSFQEALSNSLREILTTFSQNMCPPVTNVRVSEFSGDKSLDVIEWLDRFEQETISFSEDQKKNILKCAFVKAARAWFKNDLEPKLPSLTWEQTRKVILQRYKPDKVRYYVEQLLKLTYSQDQDLSSFVDQRIYLAKKAYPTLKDTEIIRDCVLALPANVRSFLNLMSDTSKLDTIGQFKSLASRYDSKIDISISQPPAKVLDQTLFESLLQKAVEKVTEKLNKVESQVAAIAKEKEPVDANNNVTDNQNQPQYRNYQNRRVQYPRREYRPRYAPRMNQAQPRPYSDANQQGPSTSQQRDNQQYYQQPRRRPPRPCSHCGGDHWNRDCPRNHLNSTGC